MSKTIIDTGQFIEGIKIKDLHILAQAIIFHASFKNQILIITLIKNAVLLLIKISILQKTY